MEFRTEFADYKDELAFLRAYLTEQGYLYYVLDAPVIPDYEYDRPFVLSGTSLCQVTRFSIICCARS